MKRIAVLLLMTVFSGSAQTNLVKNGGFENTADPWNAQGITINRFDKKAGQSSGLLSQYVGSEWKGIDQSIDLKPGAYAVKFSVWMKSEGIAKGKEAYNAGVMAVEFLNGSKSLGHENIATVSGTTPWKSYERTVVLPSGTRKVRIMIALAQTSGVLQFDQVSAIAISLPEFEQQLQQQQSALSKLPEFSNGDFESGLAAWSGQGQVSGKGRSGKALSLVSTQPAWTGQDQRFSAPENATEVTVSGWLRADGIQTGKEPWNQGVFILECCDASGKKTAEDRSIGGVSGSSDWTFFEKTISLPPKTTQLRIMIALSDCTGELIADDVRVVFPNH